MIIKIKPPEGWQNPKHAQMVVDHFAKYGATLELDIEQGVVKSGVFSLPDDMPTMPDKDDESEGGKAARVEIRRVAKVNDLVRMYTWQRVG